MSEQMTAEEWTDRGYELFELKQYEEALLAFNLSLSAMSSSRRSLSTFCPAGTEGSSSLI